MVTAANQRNRVERDRDGGVGVPFGAVQETGQRPGRAESHR